MGQKKLIRFEAVKSFPNVLQYPEGMAGQWGAFFRNDHPLTLELACGKGEYTVGLARMYPNRNFLGVDMKGNRIYIGAKRSLEEKITNAAFLRTHIRLYQRILAPGGKVHLKTDSPILYQFTKWVIAMYGLCLLEDIDDIHAGEVKPELKITTHYEALDIAQSKKVYYLCFVIPEGPLPDHDVQLLTRIKEEEPTPATPVRPPRIHASPKKKDEAAD